MAAPLEHRTVQAVAGRLRELGAFGEVVVLEAAAPTAAAAAAQLGCPAAAIANSLVFDAGREPVLVMASGAARVDVAVVADVLGVGSVTKASPGQVREHTGMAIGGVAPVGHPHPLCTLVDLDLSRFDTVWAAAGHPHTVFPTTYDELVRITAGTPAQVR